MPSSDQTLALAEPEARLYNHLQTDSFVIKSIEAVLKSNYRDKIGYGIIECNPQLYDGYIEFLRCVLLIN